MAAKFPEEDIADESSIKGEESDSKNDDAPSEAKIHDNLLQLRTETPWKKVEKRQKGTRIYEPSSAPQTRGGRGQHSTSRGGRAQRGRGHDRGPKPTRGREPSNAQQTGGGRGGRAQRGRGHDRRPTRGRGNGVFSRSSDRNGYILKDVRYERNKLYVLGLHHRVTKECLLHYIEKISNYDVKHILWFKPNGRAIVTLDPETIDFQRICREAQKRPLTLNKERKDDVSDVLIERAPVCKSIFVRGIPLNTPEEEIENHFEKLGIVEKFCFNTKEVKERRAKEMRAIVYFKSEKSVKKIVDNDNFLDGTLLAVERYYPFMGTVEPVDSKIPQYTESRIPLCEGPYFRMVVDQDTIEFVMSKSNRGLELQEKLSAERANINWTNKDGYVLVKYNSKGHKRDNEFDDQDWEERCRHILSDLLDRFTLKDIPVEKEIWKQVINELPQIESLFPNYSAQIKKLDDLEELRLICLKTDMPEFEKKLLNRIEEVKQAELEKTLEHKTLTNFPIVILKLMEMVGIQSILKENVHQDIQTRIELAQKSIFIKTPQGQMSAAVAYLREREKEVKQNSTQSPPEIIGILKTKVGKRKLNTEFKESNLHCTFNIDESNNKILFLGRAPEDTVRGRKVAEATLITGRLHIKDRDNDILQSDEWKQLCRNFEKRSKVRCQRGSVTEFHVFGFKKGVDEVVKALTKFLNEKKAKEGEFRFNSPVHQRLFREFYKDEITKLEESLSLYSVKISWEENGDMHFTGAVEGVKEVTNKLNAMQEDITEETFKVILPGMRSFLAKNKEEVVGVVEKENECVIEIQECMGEWQDPDDFDEISSISSEEEAFDEDDYTIVTQEGKKIIWKIGRIEEEEAGVLVCSVGSNLKLSIGAVARAFNETGGPALQRALNETGIHYLDPGKVLRVHLPLKAGKLACDHVVFCVCCPWSDGKTAAKQTLQGLMRNCFDATSKVGCGSIALPLIGTGNLDFPHDVAVQVMVDEALSYSKTFPNSPIEEFRFIVYEKDQEGISGFEDKFKHFKDDPQRTFPLQKKPSIGQLSGKRKKTPPSSESKCAKVYIGDVLLEVVKGDITEQRTDGIINVVRKDMQMTTGKLSTAILEVCGEEVQEELSKYYPQPLGSVVTTSAGKLKVHWIIHMVVGSGKRQHLLKCIQEALKEARNKGLKTISIPAIGSGGLGLSPQDSAEVVIGSLQEVYLGTIRSIRIVVIEDSVINVYERKLKLMKAELRCTPGYTELDDDEEGGADATSMSWCYHHNVTVYGRNKRLAEAIASLKDKVIRECPPTDITEDVIERLSSRCRRHLRRKAREEDVGLDFSKPGTITLTGFSTDVIKMHTEVTKVLQEQLKNEHLMERAEIMSRNVQWCFLTADGKNEPFEKMANYEIETAQQSNEPSVYFTHRKSQAEIVFAQDNVTFNITGAVRKVIRKDVLPLPKNWDCHPLDAKKRKVKVHPVRLDADSPEYKDVNEKFMRSISENICVTSIQRIQNPSMYRSYATKRQSMDEKNGNHKNEWYLFHGTAYRNVKDINAHGLNRSFCGRNGATYGDGVYFATESSYSLSFSKPPNSKGECCMYLAKVLAGKYADGEKGMRQPPPIDQERPDLRFDSVVDTSHDPTIFVIFHDDQCYPEYLITFTRPADGYAAT